MNMFKGRAKFDLTEILGQAYPPTDWKMASEALALQPVMSWSDAVNLL